ncbi:MAG: cytochrome b N-terminal domain-containing protein [Xanthomonadales bacterium]
MNTKHTAPTAGTDQPPGRADERRYLRNFLLHFRPASVPEPSVRFTLTWGLGGSALVLLILLFLTGFLLQFVYEPSLAGAYGSILALNEQAPFGRLLRNLHRWSGYGLLLVVFLHFLRVFYTSAFLPPRRANWLVGLVLLGLVSLSNFTGYLLPWDQISYWAVTISTSTLDYLPLVGPELKRWVLGGAEPGQATLLNFYALHTAVLPVVLLFLVSFHFWRIRKAQGIVLLRKPGKVFTRPPTMIPTVPHVVTREAALALTVVAVLLAIAMVFDAPLAERANPGLSPNPTKAPWYFMGIQEMLLHLHPLFAALVVPALVLAGLVAIPFLRYDTNAAGIWFVSPRGRRLAVVSAAAGFALTAAAVWIDDRVLRGSGAAPADLLRNGLLPFTVIALACGGWYYGLRRILNANRNEARQALFTLLLAAFTTLMLIGIWLRGPGMQLQWAG